MVSLHNLSPASGRQSQFGKAIGFVAGGIGDQIYHLTQLRALAAASTGGVIDIACISPGPIGTLLAHTTWVNAVIDARPLRRYVPGLRGEPAVRSLRQNKYDTAFFMHRSTSFKLAAMRARISHRVGLSGQKLDRFLLHHSLSLNAGGDRRQLWGHRPFIAAIDEYVQAQGLILDDTTPTITPNATETAEVKEMLGAMRGPITIVNLYALDPARRWPIADAIQVITRLATETKGTFLLNAGPDASAYHHEAMTAWHTAVAQNPALNADQLRDSLTLNPSMAKDVALYQAANYYMGVDSFTANLALNSNLQSLILFAKSSDILRYRPYCEPIAAPIEGQIGSISPADILAGFERLRSRT